MIKNSLRVLFICLILAAPAYASPLEDCAEYAVLGLPSDDGTLLCRTGYLLAHDGDFKTPIWVIQRLTKEKALLRLPRKESFKVDPDLKKGERAEITDYKGSGWDRGHMAPSADFGWSAQAMAETYYLSNMVPQDGKNNSGIWAQLEAHARDWAIVRGEVFIYTGPIYDDDFAKRTIGKNHVGIPDKLYKIVYDPKREEAIAFIMPNEYIPPKDLPNYAVSVRDIEYITGLNFLSALPRKTQNRIEKAKPGMWGKTAVEEVRGSE